MRERLYPAVVHKNEYGFGVSFPDLPGCISAGDTIEDCLRNAGDAAHRYLATVLESGGTAPAAMTIEAAWAGLDPEDHEELATIELVAVTLPS